MTSKVDHMSLHHNHEKKELPNNLILLLNEAKTTNRTNFAIPPVYSSTSYFAQFFQHDVQNIK